MSPNRIKFDREAIANIVMRIEEELDNSYGFSEFAELHFEIDGYDISVTVKEKNNG